MILAIDIGNTTVGIGGVENAGTEQCRVRVVGKMETNRDWDTKAYTETLRNLLAEKGMEPKDFCGAVMSSVVPPVQQAIQESVHQVFGMETMVITCRSDLGITVGVDEPEKVGRDRLVDSAWAAANYPLPVVTADLGTATTFNVIGTDRVLCGGVIAAGMLTGLRALAVKTAQLPELDVKRMDHVIGKNTAECMISGAVAGTAALLDGIVADIEEELGSAVTLVITGGGAKYADRFVRHPHVYEPDMILKGLGYLFMRNHTAE